MPIVENVKATVVLEFNISTTVSNAASLVKVEGVLDSVLRYKDDATSPINIRSVRVKSMTVESKNG